VSHGGDAKRLKGCPKTGVFGRAGHGDSNTAIKLPKCLRNNEKKAKQKPKKSRQGGEVLDIGKNLHKIKTASKSGIYTVAGSRMLKHVWR